MKQILFKDKVTRSLGRNGTMATLGLALMDFSRLQEDNTTFDVVSIWPINSRKVEGQCWIELPLENVPELIYKLQEILNSKLPKK